MKKLFFMAVAAIAALSSCTSDNELELNKNTGKEALTFTATMEDSEATRVTFDNDESCAVWEVNDQISINGVSYSAQTAGTTSTFTATTTGEEAEGPTYNAYFPADLYDGTTATLPAIQTYTAGKFNMPMYATSSSTELAFKNLCAVLAIKVTSADIATLKSIKVASDKKMNGKFTVTDKAAVINDEEGTNVVVLESSEAITLTSEGTTFYIAIPAQTYQYLNIFLSADGKTYTQAMATKKAAGLGEIARSTIFNINYAKNATKLWKGNLFIADCNVGATSGNVYGGHYSWGGSQDKVIDDCYTGSDNLSGNNDTATKLWGSNWRMPTSDELTALKDLGALDGTNKGLLCTGQGDYSSNSVFLPAAGYCMGGYVYDPNEQGYYWASSFGENGWEGSTGFALSYHVIYDNLRVDKYSIYQGYSVRAVLEEAASPAPAAPATTGTAKATIGGSEVDVNWVQLWAGGPKFAEYNVGVTDGKAESYGNYFEWSSTDIATTQWGSKWRMPTSAELQALINSSNVQWQWTGSGYNFTGKGDYASNSIFLPAAGYRYGGSIVCLGSYGGYWSSSPNDESTAFSLLISSGNHVMSFYRSKYGFSVRAVLNE